MAAAVLMLAGCPQQDPPAADAGRDAGADRGAELGNFGDLLIPSDLTLPAACDMACLLKGLHLCVADSTLGRCVECTSDQHCLANPGALGPRCDIESRRCTCSDAADCSHSLRGPLCDSTTKTCSCKSNSQCKGAFPLCSGSGGARTCVRPCATAAHCPNPAAPRCHTPSGRCVACLSDEQCKGHPRGARCGADQRCTCEIAGNHCQLAASWGSQCVTIGQQQRCGCLTHSDCPLSLHGPVCDVALQRCTCTSDDQCTLAANTRCAPPHAGAGYKQCVKPCKADNDCKTRPGLPRCLQGFCVGCRSDADCAGVRPRCDTGRRRCVSCLADAHCSAESPFCDLALGTCAQCRSHGDCSASLDGGTCIEGYCGCTSDTDCKTTAAWGSRCHPVFRRCSCSGSAHCAGVSSGPQCDHTLQKCICKGSSDCKAPHSSCTLPYLGASYLHCQKPCTDDTTCAGKPGLLRCNSKTGACLPCLTDAHCSARPFAKFCEVTLAIKGCLQCKQDSHCSTASLGKICATTEGTCYCTTAAHCSANLNGHRCHDSLQICSCKTHSDCPVGRKCTGTYKKLGVLLCE